MVDQEKLRQAITSVIQAIGDDPAREGLTDTPRRVAEMYGEFFSGLDQDPAKVLVTGFEEGHKEMVVLRDLPFFSMCEHHLLPFLGSGSIGYVPNGRVVGASNLGRALDTLARRPQLQERLTQQLADTISSTLRPDGVAVILKAQHMCMSLRGVKKPGAELITSVHRGTLRTNEATRREFYALLRAS